MIYSQKINDPDSGKALGVLCLCFNLEDEADRIFKDLGRGNSSIVSAILDGDGQIMFASSHSDLPEGTRIPVDTNADFRLMDINGKTCFVTTVPTDGYQGFFGLTWYGMAVMPTRVAFKHIDTGSDDRETDMLQDLTDFSGDLSALRKKSVDLLGAMKIDSINGEVQAAKFRANAFVKVLHFVKGIGEDIDGLFSEAIENLQQTVATSLFSDVEFRAFQGNNIADRNLYERANDVCWWALTPLFRTLLAKHAKEGLTSEESSSLKTNLQYINDLYTPYLRLVLADTGGTVLAVSDPPDELEEKLADDTLPTGQAFIGTQADPGLVHKAMTLASSKDYAVSDFVPSPFTAGGIPISIPLRSGIRRTAPWASSRLSLIQNPSSRPCSTTFCPGTRPTPSSPAVSPSLPTGTNRSSPPPHRNFLWAAPSPLKIGCLPIKKGNGTPPWSGLRINPMPWVFRFPTDTGSTRSGTDTSTT